MAAIATRTLRLKVVRLPHARDLPLPAYQTSGAAGLDLVAAVASDKPLMLKRGERVLVPTGLVLELPPGIEAQVRPRSGLALRHGITVLNAPGTIDSDYRGEVQVILINLGRETFAVRRGERIAQLVVAPVLRATLVQVATARATPRGAGGFGSTGAATAKSKPRPAKKPRKSAVAAAKRATRTKRKAVRAFARRKTVAKPRGRR